MDEKSNNKPQYNQIRVSKQTLRKCVKWMTQPYKLLSRTQTKLAAIKADLT